MDNKTDKEIRLLEKGKKSIFNIIFSRKMLYILLLLIQIGAIFFAFKKFDDILPYVFGGQLILEVVVVLYLLNTNINPTAKITWLIIILGLPVFGVLLFIFIQSEVGHRVVKRRLKNIYDLTSDYITQDEETIKELNKKDKGIASLAKYIKSTGDYPVYNNSTISYFKSGEDKFKELIKELKKAKKFIFLEYFIIDEGLMWGEVLEILIEKVKEGVDVRLIYDGACEYTTLNLSYKDKLQELGIKTKVFAPIRPIVSTIYNYRDHRKIVVIDGKVAFNGGVNLADEYINKKDRFGYWKDSAILIKGEAVKSFTLMFLQMWNIDEKDMYFNEYLNTKHKDYSDGYIIPYGDCPLDDYKVGKQVYIDILNRANDYVYIMTPYLILDGEMENTLTFTAQRGVDVRIILPGIPDKKYAYALAKTHFKSLVNAGVKVYNFTPGFVHSKVFVSDDKEAVVGTINLDYRSLYHHYECATYMYKTKCICDIKKDYDDTLSKCKEVTIEDIKKEKLATKLTGIILKAVAPLL